MRGGRDRGLEQLLASCTELYNANHHPVAMVIYSLSFHCAKYFISQRNVFTLYVTVLTLYSIIVCFSTSNLCHLFLYESDNK